MLGPISRVLAPRCAGLLDEAGATDRAELLMALGVALKAGATLQVKAAAERIGNATSVETEQADGRKVGSAIQSLSALHKVLVVAGTKAAIDLEMFASALEGKEAMQISAISATLASKPKSQNGVKPTTLDSVAVRLLADDLVAANNDDTRFKVLMDEIKAKRLSKPVLTAVANKFLGVEPSRTYKTAAAAFQRMEERHFHDAISASRERAINQINH